MLLRNVQYFFQATDAQHIISIRYLLSVLRVRALIDTTPSSDEHLILYFSIDSSTVRSRLEGGSREVRDVDARGWGDEGANVINYPSNDSDWWAAGQVQPGRNSVEMVMVTNERWNRVIQLSYILFIKIIVEIWQKMYANVQCRKYYILLIADAHRIDF